MDSNTTDAQHRRYRYGNQPSIAQWNLVQLANALYPLVGAVEPLQEALEHYAQRFEATWSQMMATKLGLTNLEDRKDRDLAEQALALLQTVETDMTLFWRELAKVNFELPVDEKGALVRPNECRLSAGSDDNRPTSVFHRLC